LSVVALFIHVLMSLQSDTNAT